MSINLNLREAARRGLVVELVPWHGTYRLLRRMYLAREVYAQLAAFQQMPPGEYSAQEAARIQRFARLQSDLEQFLLNPELDTDYLKPLVPEGKGVFEIRSRRPKPSIRVFGMFPEKDRFVIGSAGKLSTVLTGGVDESFQER